MAQVNLLTDAPMECSCGHCDVSFGFLAKSMEGASDTDRRVDGMASCEKSDLQDEEVFQKGIDFRPLIASGWLNWDHKSDPQHLIGKAIHAEIADIQSHHVMRKSGLDGLGMYFLGKLVEPGLPAADAAWWHLQHPVEGRPLSFSLQGRSHERDRYSPKRIMKCEVRHMALTHQPIQTASFAQMAKSMGMAKTMDSMTAAPLRLEHLAGPLTGVIWGDCGENHFGYTGKFRKGRLGALDHLTKCRGHDIATAHGFLKSLITSELVS